MSIFENAALVRESAHVYKQVCGANLHLNGRRYFSIPFKLGQSGSAALPLPRVPPFLSVCTLFLYARISETVACINNLHTAYKKGAGFAKEGAPLAVQKKN